MYFYDFNTKEGYYPDIYDSEGNRIGWKFKNGGNEVFSIGMLDGFAYRNRTWGPLKCKIIRIILFIIHVELCIII